MPRSTEERRKQMIAESFRKHTVTKLRAAYPSIAKDANDDELFQVWHRLNIPDATPDEADEVLSKVYGEDWKVPEFHDIKEPTNLGALAGDVTKGVAQGAAEFGGASAVKAIAKSNPLGQLAMAVPTGIRAAGRQMAGQSLEKTAAEMPEPNIEDLRNRGMSEEQIHNIMKGYTDTQQSLMSDVEEMGKGGVEEASMGIANSLFLNPSGKWIEKMGGKLASGGGKLVENIVKHGAAGAALGGGYSGTQQAVQKASEAAAAGAKADEILSAASNGALEGGKFGAVVGGALGGVGGIVGTAITHAAERKATAAKAVNDALTVRLRNFGKEFRPQWLTERFPEDFKLANDSGLPDETLAHNIVANVYGPEIAASENGMRATSDIFEKIASWRKVNEGLVGPMVELPKTPIGPVPAGIEASPIIPPGGEVPSPNTYDMGPMGERPAPVPPPEGMPQMPGLEGMPTPQQGQVPFQLETMQPQEPQPADARLSQPLGADVATNRASSPIPSPEPQERLQQVPPEAPELTLQAPPALVAPQPGPVPVRNSSEGPADFGVRELTAPQGEPPNPVEQLTLELQTAISAGDLQAVEAITQMIKKTLRQQKLAARREKVNAKL